MDRAAYAGLSLFKHARHTLGSHCSGLAGLIVFEYLVFKHSLSKVPMNHSETIPLYSLIFSKCLLVSTVLFSCAALFASASYMMIDYARRVAIDKGMTMGLALQLPVEGIQGSWLGSVTVLLACLNMAILIFDLMCTEISETSHSERGLSGLFSNDFCAELVARVGPLLFYMLNLRDIARSPKISWYRYQKLMQNPCSVDELLGSLGSRSGELTAPPSCPRQCWTSFLSLLGVKPPQRASEGIEMQHFSDRERSSRISEGFSHVRSSWSELGRTKTFEKVFGTDAPHLLHHFPALVADRPGASFLHTCLLYFASEDLLGYCFHGCFDASMKGITVTDLSVFFLRETKQR